MSFVFLAGARVYKLKKPLRRAYLDFTTLAARERAVREELRLNRRLAPDVYLGARALRRLPGGELSLGAQGEVVDWLVEMRRLPEEAALDRRITAGNVTQAEVEELASLLVRFYRALPPADVSTQAYLTRLSEEIDLTAGLLSDPAIGFDGARLETALARLREAFAAARPALGARVGEGRVVEGHGDLRPEHVFLTRPPVIIDCLEFSAALRAVDPFDEISLLGVECARLGGGWIYGMLRERLAQGLGDEPPPELLAFFWRYRAMLRARLTLAHLTAPVVRNPERWRPLAWRYVELADRPPITPPQG
ncbi:MAG: hypothetical protein D6811_03445 [Alphaproteobacteria bacterium]|nr:MAG: hypothetical protein D6811_03445 [Alphaproteobacteria bacterium]